LTAKEPKQSGQTIERLYLVKYAEQFPKKGTGANTAQMRVNKKHTGKEKANNY